MTFPGPWIQPPDAERDAGFLTTRTSTRHVHAVTNLGFGPPNSEADRNTTLQAALDGDSYAPWDGGWTTGAGESRSFVDFPATDTDAFHPFDYLDFPDAESTLVFNTIEPAELYMPPAPTGAPPPGAVDVEYEADRGTILSAMFVGTLEALHAVLTDTVATTAYALVPSEAQYAATSRFDAVPTGTMGNTGNSWWTAGDLAAMAMVASVTATTVGVRAHTAFEVPVDVTLPVALLVVATGLQVGGTPNFYGRTEDALLRSPHGTYSGNVWQGDTSGAHVLYTYRPPRFRWMFAEAPPQRQFPRDDGLAASTRRSWPTRSSRQRGSRRGPDATYL